MEECHVQEDAPNSFQTLVLVCASHEVVWGYHRRS
jgi:hypothetical protein